MERADNRARRPPRDEATSKSRGAKTVGLVLSGGGARGAYELGALSILLPALQARGELPRILVGTSVGAINVAGLAATSHLAVEDALARELSRWEQVERGAVIRPVLQRLPLTAVRFAGGTLGIPGVRLESLLDPSPLKRNLTRWIDWRRLHRNVAARTVRSLAVIATAARTGRPVAFVEGALAASAHRSHVVDYVEARVEPTHVRASAAIPLLFPPVRVTRPAGASGWYVDGGTRLNTPIKPAIDLGAGRVVVIGTGSVIPPVKHPGRHEAPPPDFAVGAQHLLQGALADPLVEDLRRLGEINLFYADADSSPAAVRHRRARGRPPYRRIPYIFIAPRGANAIADLASDVFRERYRGVRALRSPDLVLLNRLLGGAESSHGDLLSYLFFDPEFIRALVTMGKEDARAWLRAPPGPEEPWQVDPLDAFTESGRTPQRKARSRAPRARP